jgi:hypothetical protein
LEAEDFEVVAGAEATGKLKEKVSEEGPLWASFFVQFLLAQSLIFTHYYKRFNPTDIVKRLGDFFRDCRKSPNVAILENSHIVKSTTYVSEKTRFKVFRQSLL